MLAESGISVAPLERPRAPDAKHMAPTSSNTRSRARRTEPLPAVVEKSASSDDSDSNDDNDTGKDHNDSAKDDNDSSENNNDKDGSENENGSEDKNGSDEENGSDEDDSDSGENDSGNSGENDSGKKNDSDNNAEDNENDDQNNAEDDQNNAEDDDQNNAKDNGQNDGEDNGEDNSEDNGKNDGQKDNADVPIIPIPAPRPSGIGTPVRGSEPTTAILPVPATASAAPNPTRNWVSGSPARGGELTTAVLLAPAPFCTPARGSVVLTAASAGPTPSREPNQQGSEIPTTASAVLALEPSIGKDSGASPTDLESIGEGSLFYFVVLSLFIFNLVSTPPMGPLPDNGIKIYFSPTSYFKNILDVKMSSPISLQGASRTTGGILRGKAYGNQLNHADFEREEDPGGVMLIKPKQAFKIFIYVQYGDVLVMSRVPDFGSQDPVTVFVSNAISPLTQPLLEKATQYHDFISCKHCIFITVT